MLGFFPHPYPDELMFSVLARYHKWSGNTCITNSILELFGSRNITSNINFITNLDKLISNLPIGTKYTAEEFVFNNTLIPLFTPFLSQQNYNIVLAIIKNGNSSNQKYRLGSFGTKILRPKYLRFCPECAREDYNLYGELYWHRNHQIAVTLLCPKHKVLIRNSSVLISRIHKRDYLSATTENCDIEDSIEELDSTYYPNNKILFELAEDVHWLLTHKIFPKSHNWFKNAFITLFKPQGYLTPSGKIYSQKLINDFVNYYGEGFLGLMDSSINRSADASWINKILRKQNFSMHPIRYILLANFLQKSISEIINSALDDFYNEESRPFFNNIEDAYSKSIMKNLIRSHKKKAVINAKNSTNVFFEREEYCREKVNWVLRDEEILEKIRTTVCELSNLSTKPIRITVVELEKAIGSRDLKFNLDKLPKTKNYLENAVESTDAYRIRKVHWAARILFQENKELTASKIMVKANINRKKISKKVAEEIEYTIRNYGLVEGFSLVAASQE